MSPTIRLEPVAFAALDGWAADDHTASLRAFRRTAARHLDRPLRSRPLSPFDGFDAIARASLGVDEKDARAFFEHHFSPHRIGTGKLTAYFEPIVSASRERDAQHTVPLYARPPELVDLPDPDMRYGLLVDGRAQPYHDRAAIQAGALGGRGLEIAWLRDAVDAFVVHVQGAAQLLMTDGTVERITYAAKSGHPYTSLGAALLHRWRDEGRDVSPRDVTADRLLDWMRAHPNELPDFLALNRSYIFFERTPSGEASSNEGPIAAAKVPLEASRSLAVDRSLHSFGLPFWLQTQEPLPDEREPMRRLLVAQDTGSAIVGPARGDLFVGSGDAAGRHAGRVNHETDFHVLLPKVEGRA